MKKLCLFIAVVSFTFIVNAQDQPTSDVGVKFGVKAGVNFATIGGDDTSGIKSRTGFHVGAVAEISIIEKFSVQPEILYSAQGYKWSEDGDEGTEKYDYLNFPVMAKYYVAEGFSLEAGPQIGFLLSAKWDYKSGSYSESGDAKDYLKGVDVGFNLGVGYKLDIGLNFGARYYLGLSDIYDTSDYYYDYDYSGSNHNNVFQISVGYMF